MTFFIALLLAAIIALCVAGPGREGPATLW
jgi:hypothetical protein